VAQGATERGGRVVYIGGTVDVIDLRALQKVATIDVGQQAGGIDFWKVAPSR